MLLYNTVKFLIAFHSIDKHHFFLHLLSVIKKKDRKDKIQKIVSQQTWINEKRISFKHQQTTVQE